MEDKMVKEEFPFVEIPDRYKEIIGIPDPGTRLFRAYGNEEESKKWFDAVFDICQGPGSVSPGGAAGYARVSRPGVHQKIKAGGLTAFVYHVETTGIIFKNKKRLSANANFYCYIPVSECKAWAAELEKKRNKPGYDKEVMGDGNWDDPYIDNPPKHLKEKHKNDQKKK
jgi:hypothetical protein